MNINSINNSPNFSGFLMVRVDDRKTGVVSKQKAIDTQDILELNKSYNRNYITLKTGEVYTITTPLGKEDKYYRNLVNAYTAACQDPAINIQV